MQVDQALITAYEQSLTLRGRGRRTVEKYGRTMTQFAQWQRALTTPDALDEADALAAWINEGRRGGLAAGTVRQRLAIARSWLDWRGLDRGPLADYKLPPLPQPSPHPLPDGVAAVRKMLAAARTTASRHAIALGGLAGLRVSETIALTREDVEQRGGATVLNIRGKGERRRIVPVSGELAVLLEEMPATGRLVPLSNTGARVAITRTADEAGVTGSTGAGVSSHDLRATFATEVYERTRDVILVQRLLGHASVTTTQVYISSSITEAQMAVEF